MDAPLAKHLLQVLSSDIGDFGAGGGWYTNYFQRHGKKSTAYDASPSRGSTVNFIDLSKAVMLNTTFDWVLCLEVGEHIPASSENIFLTNIVTHAKKGIVISWAIPGQGGNGHVNERPNDWVKHKMKDRGWVYDIDSTAMLRNAASFAWFKNTIMVFVRSNDVISSR